MNKKEIFLLDTYCEDLYEQIEMKKWINEKGVDIVYDIVIDMFYNNDDTETSSE